MGKRVLFAFIPFVAVACNSSPAKNDPCHGSLEDRAYIVSKGSDEVDVIDLTCLELVGKISTGGVASHMLELNADFTKAYVDSEESNETIVFDTAKLVVTKKITTPRHPTHLSLTKDGKYFAVVAELDNVVYFIDNAADEIVATIPNFMLPHFTRMSLDGRFGYVANLDGHHISRDRSAVVRPRRDDPARRLRRSHADDDSARGRLRRRADRSGDGPALRGAPRNRRA